MTSQASLQWRQTSPGVWQRAIDELEEFYAAIAILYEGSGRMFFAMMSFLSLSITLQSGESPDAAKQRLHAALQKAWLTLRFKHPTLASQITQDVEAQTWTKTYRQISDNNAREDWLRKTLVFVPDSTTGLEWANSDPPAPKVPTMFVITPPLNPSLDDRSVRCDLVFRSPHDIIDGIGTLMMLNNFMTETSAALDQGDAFHIPDLNGAEATNLTPCYRVAAGVPAELTDAQKVRIQDIARGKAAARNPPQGTELLVLPHRKSAVSPGRHPTHVFHAAAAVVDRDLQPKVKAKRRVRYINYILRNERAACAPPFNSALHPAGVFHSTSGQSLVVDMEMRPETEPATGDERRQEFRSIVEIMKNFYHEVRDDAEHSQLAPELWRLGVPKLPPSPRPLPVPGPDPTPSVSISSMGRVDAIVKPVQGVIRVHDVWVTGEELRNSLGLFLGTFAGRLCLSAAYNDAWHTKADMDDFLERCKAAAFHGLGITK